MHQRPDFFGGKGGGSGFPVLRRLVKKLNPDFCWFSGSIKNTVCPVVVAVVHPCVSCRSYFRPNKNRKISIKSKRVSIQIIIPSDPHPLLNLAPKARSKFFIHSNTGAFCTKGAEGFFVRKLNPETAKKS